MTHTYKKIGITAVLLFIISSMIVFHDAAPVRLLRSGVVGGLQPLMRLAGATGRAFAATESFSDIRIRQLEFENQTLLAEVSRMREALRFDASRALRIRGADVLLYQRTLGREFLVVAAGANHGVSEGDVVLSGSDTFVGRVVRVGARDATVDIASNPGTSFEAVLFAGSGTSTVSLAPLLTNGLGGRAFMFDLLPNSASISPGDHIAVRHDAARNIYWLFADVVRETGSPSAPFRTGRATLLARPELLNEVFIVMRDVVVTTP